MNLLEDIKRWQRRGIQSPQAAARGRVVRTVGLTLEARGIDIPLGGRCAVETVSGRHSEVEVVGFESGKTYLMPLYPLESIKAGASVVPIDTIDTVPAGEGLLGRVINGLGEPLDGKNKLIYSERIPFQPDPINPLERTPIQVPLDVGIRSINSMLTVGRGRRIGLFAGSGVGKSVLLGMMTRFTAADIVIVALVGER